jgi:hypothetical protein
MAVALGSGAVIGMLERVAIRFTLVTLAIVLTLGAVHIYAHFRGRELERRTRKS